MLLWPMAFRQHITPMQCGTRFRDAFLSRFGFPFSTIVFSMKLHIDFRFDPKGIGIEEDSKLEN